MTFLRATQAVLRNLPAPTAAPGSSDTALGDWYVTRVVADRQPLLLVVSAASRLALLLRARDVRSLPERLPRLVAERLHRLGVAAAVVEAEVGAMTPVVTARTTDRSVLGSMNEFCYDIPFVVSRHGTSDAGLLAVEAHLGHTLCGVSRPTREIFYPDQRARELLDVRWGSVHGASAGVASAAGTERAVTPSAGVSRARAGSGSPRAKRVCGLCGKSGKLIRTECCNQWICDDADKYVLFSFANNSCFRNHTRFTLCAYHYHEQHPGSWKDCVACRAEVDTEMYVYYGTNVYNFETLENPPAFEPTRCATCSKVIRRGYEGHSSFDRKFYCEACTEERRRSEERARASRAGKNRPAASRPPAQVIDLSEERKRRAGRTRP